MKGFLNMRIGQNLGSILLDISQSAIEQGDVNRAIETYTKSFVGFNEEYVIKLLKNECVLITCQDNVSVNMTDEIELRSNNKDNIRDWDFWLKNRLSEMMDICHTLVDIERNFEKKVHSDILNYDICAPVKEYFGFLYKKVGIYNIAAKLIAGDGFANLYSNGENTWSKLCDNVERDDALKYEYALYFIVKYIDCIRLLHKAYINFAKSCLFLFEHNMAQRPVFFEDKVEYIIDKLVDFADTTKGYYHPMCNTKLYEYKNMIDDDILSTSWGKEFRKFHIIEKNIMDGYDAGWLSPDGKFYGENGTTSSMIHIRIAEKLKCGDIDGDRRLEEEGWIKIHGNEVYGSFIGYVNPRSDFPYQYSPTEIQIKMVCDYIDKFHNGKLHTQPQIVRVTEPVSTYRLRQMDKIKLHDIFSI